jgi:hypothetical protein
LFLSIIFCASAVLAPASAEPTTYKVSGYVTSSNGAPISGTKLLFFNTSGYNIYPDLTTNSSGGYSANAPPGIYTIEVLPPFDSYYVNYLENSFSVNSDIIKNVTLTAGCKVSGYITNSTGAPMVRASVMLKTNGPDYSSGWYSTDAGYYYVNVLAGTYTIDARPANAYDPSLQGCTYFSPYLENNFLVTSNMTKNIFVDTSTITPTPTPSPTPIQSPSPSPSPTPTPSYSYSPSPTIPEFPSAIAFVLLMTGITIIFAIAKREK